MTNDFYRGDHLDQVMGYDCPACGAVARQPCVNPDRVPAFTYHTARRDAMHATQRAIWETFGWKRPNHLEDEFQVGLYLALAYARQVVFEAYQDNRDDDIGEEALAVVIAQKLAEAMEIKACPTAWGSHACNLPAGHPGIHRCDMTCGPPDPGATPYQLNPV